MTHFLRLLSSTALCSAALIAFAGPVFAETDFERANPTSFGSYLAGQQALNDLRTSDAARFFHDAEESQSHVPAVVERSFTAYLANGDIEKAVGLAGHLLDLAPDFQMAKLVLAVEDVKERRYKAAIKELDGFGTDSFPGVASGILRSWALTGDDRRAEAFSSLDKLGSTGLTDFLAFHRALMADVAGDSADAIDLAAKAYNANPNVARTVEAYVRILSDAGRFDDASAVIAKFDAKGLSDPVIDQVKKSVDAHTRPGMFAPSVQSGVAEMFRGIAIAVAGDGSNDQAVTLLQLGAYLDPHNDNISLLLGQLLDGAGQHDEANTYYDNIPATSPFKVSATVHIAQNFDSMGNRPEAIKRLTDIVQADSKNLDALSLLAELLRIDKQYDKAAGVDTQALAVTGGNQPADWALYYQRGIAYERSNQWDKAQPDFLKALDLNPDQPDVLNYLGYTWVDKGENLNQALDMIQKAVRAHPTDGFIVDSLGWAFYKLNRIDEAVQTLEQAVQLKPNDAAINNHLGDAYWQAGRKLEAHFQWSIASSLDTDGTLKAEIATKQLKGLNAASTSQ